MTVLKSLSGEPEEKVIAKIHVKNVTESCSMETKPNNLLHHKVCILIYKIIRTYKCLVYKSYFRIYVTVRTTC